MNDATAQPRRKNLRHALHEKAGHMAIRHKLVVVIMLTCITALALAALIFISYHFMDARHEMVQNLKLHAEMIGTNCQAALAFNAPHDAEAILGALAMEPGIAYACIHDQKGQLFCRYSREGTPLPASQAHLSLDADTSFVDGYMCVSCPIYDKADDKRIGSVMMWSDLSQIKQLFRRHVVVSIAILVLTSLAAFLISNRIQGLISSPILPLAEVARAVSSQKQYSMRAPKQGNDEVGMLIDSFNDMLEQIQERDLALVAANEMLEARVQERTAKLSQANEQLKAEMGHRNRAEAALRERERRYRTLLKNIPQKIFYKDLDSVYQLCNESYAEDLGLALPDDICGKTDYHFHPEDVARKYIADDERIISTGEPEEIEEVYHHEGRAYIVRTLKSPVRDEEGDVIGIFGIFWDITERKEAEQALAELNRNLEATVQELRRSNRELQDFAYVTAHDLKAPLRAIGTLVDWLYADYQAVLDEQGREQMQLVKGRVLRMNELIDGILHYSEIGRGGRGTQQVDLEALVTDLMAAEVLPEDFTVRIEGSLPVVTGERIHLWWVFQNLIGNAIKYMDKPAGRITIRYEDKPDHWEFCVADNGPGIDEKYHAKIFKIFQTLSPRDEIESTGIGLAVVKKIVELYGGKVWVESTLHTGSAFCFTLPKSVAMQETADVSTLQVCS
jgi:PAS domain S-box-containing protein